MEMLQLKYFYDSAQNESFAKTAKKYMVPTTSVSASVRRLEAELGCPLFDRTGNSIALNQKGRDFFASIKHIFAELDGAISQLHNPDVSEKQKINIYTQNLRSTVTYYMKNYRKTHPQTNFFLGVDFEEKDFDKYDILVVRENHERFADYEGFEYRTFNVMIEASEHNPICERRLTLKQLEGYPFITTGTNNEIYKIFTKACERQGFTPNYIFECNDYQCAERCQMQGMGLGVTITRSGGTSSGMRHLNITDFNEKLVIYVYYKKEKYHGAVKDFVDYIRNLVG